METRSRLLAALQGRREERLAAGMLRSLGQTWAGPFASNDYLGLAQDGELSQRLVLAISEGLPTGSTGSRLLSGGHPVFAELENDFAVATGFPGALFFASASEANRAAVTTLVGRHDAVVLDELAHASLWDGALHSQARRERFRHNDPEHLREVLRGLPATKVRLVLTESVYSMDGDVAPLSEILQVCEEEDALLLVDEAHAAGIYGIKRTGLAEQLPKGGALVATVHGCGKALGSAGGILCAPGEVIGEIVNSCREFIFTTAPSPLSAYAARQAWHLARTQDWRRAQLFALATRLQSGLEELGLAVPPRRVPTAILPILCPGLEATLALGQKLSEHGFPLRAIRAPTVPAGRERLRLTLNATQDLEEIELLLKALASALPGA